MHVALVVHDFDVNFGQGRYSVELVRRLADRCKFTVFANRFGVPPIPGVEYRHVPAVRLRAFTTVFSFLPAAELALRRAGCDLIHSQGLAGWSADIITGHICNAARTRASARDYARSRRFMRVVVPLERRFYQQRRARHLIAISKVLEQEVQREYGWKKASTVIYHGTDSDAFHPAESPLVRVELRRHFRVPEGAWTWLFIGEAVKGLRRAITALAGFPQAVLLVVSRSDFAEYRRLAAALGVADRVIFHGFEPAPEKAYRAADVFVYPSDYDPFGMVVSEAMATGLPAVVSQNIGAAELIHPGQNGYLFDPDSDASLREVLSQVAANPETAAELGRNGRETIRRVSWDRCADQTFAVYQEVHAQRLAARR